MKDGLKTSEFWLTVSMVAAMLLAVLTDLINDGIVSAEAKWAAIAGAVLTAVYTMGRSIFKSKTLIKCLPIFLVPFLVGCEAPQLMIDANEMRHTNCIVTIEGMEQLIHKSSGAPVVKAAMLRRMTMAKEIETVLYHGTKAYLEAEGAGMDAVKTLIDKVKGQLDDK